MAAGLNRSENKEKITLTGNVTLSAPGVFLRCSGRDIPN
jgi:hypothetical protein